MKLYYEIRGLRNSNPGNIRHGDNWDGMAATQPDKSFVTFKSPEYGIRAMVKILISYRKRDLVTIRGIIATWAPPVENDTSSYVKSVASYTCIDPDEILSEEQLMGVICGIIKHENGVQPYSVDLIATGMALAGLY